MELLPIETGPGNDIDAHIPGYLSQRHRIRPQPVNRLIDDGGATAFLEEAQLVPGHLRITQDEMGVHGYLVEVHEDMLVGQGHTQLVQRNGSQNGLNGVQ